MLKISAALHSVTRALCYSYIRIAEHLILPVRRRSKVSKVATMGR